MEKSGQKWLTSQNIWRIVVLMLFGEFEQQTDEKGRIRVPAKLKPFFPDGVTATKGTNGCLFLFSSSQWNDGLAEKLARVPMSDLEISRSLRLFFSAASALEEDNQGRMLLPKNLREFAQIKKEIVFIGVGNRAELWAKDVWDAYLAGKIAQNSINYDKMFAELNKYGV